MSPENSGNTLRETAAVPPGRPIPSLDPTLLVGHVCDGVVLGAGYWSLR